MQRTIHAALKADHTARTAQVNNSIVHLKGWYQAATETQAWPCFHTMERQTAERVNLHQQRDSPGPPVTVNVAPVEVRDGMPANGEIQAVVAELTNSRSAGASRKQAEHLKEWLWGIKLEEDP
jgi:hypothetical protein